MAYNDLNLGDTVVQGHKFAKKTIAHLSNQINSGTYTYTATEDCLFFVMATGNASAASLRLNTYVNDSDCIDCVTGQAGLYYFNIPLPIKKGDVVKITSTISNCWLYISLIAYR